MDHTKFDDLTRTLAGSAGNRRAVVRFLTGGTLVAVARFGLTAIGEAKQSRKTTGKDQRKGKGKGNSPKSRRCGDRCTDRGGRCCHDESCAERGSCCPGEKRCGGGCISKKSCCPYTEKECPKGRCVSKDRCCAGERQCANDVCVHRNLCCPEDKECANGDCVKPSQCCPDAIPPLCNECEKAVCVNGSLVCQPDSACQPTCPGSTPESCFGNPFRVPCGGAGSNCACLQSKAGASRCVGIVAGSSIGCTTDADCRDLWDDRAGVCVKCTGYCHPACQP